LAKVELSSQPDRLSPVSPYLHWPVDRSYRDLLDEQIAQLETERRRIERELAFLRGERERIADRGR
jgi:hypothetical protein